MSQGGLSVPLPLAQARAVALAVLAIALGTAPHLANQRRPVRPIEVPPIGRLLSRPASGSSRAQAAVGENGRPQPRLLIVAPHPDDEVLIAAGVIHRAVERGQPVDVAIVTNGDYTCQRNGYVREEESVAALQTLGLSEEHLHFLGYPDGHLCQLSSTPFPPVERRALDGRCTRACTTYASRGERRVDVHTALTGVPAPYTAEALTADLAALLTRLRPTDIYVTHPIDEHPDHARTYTFLRRALEAASMESAVIVHRAIVHAGACWPDGSDRREPCPIVSPATDRPMPPLPPPFTSYLPRERIPLPPDMAAPILRANRKYEAIATYRSQTGPHPETDWLASFARADEIFFPERLAPDPMAPGTITRVRAGSLRGDIEQHGPWHARAGAFGVYDGWTRATSFGADGLAELTSSTEQQAPLRCIFRVRDAGAGTELSFRFLDEADGTRAEVVSLEQGRELLVARSSGPSALETLRRELLPDEGARATDHTYELLADPRPDDGGVLEITVRRDGQLLGVAVDPSAPQVGQRLAVRVRGPVSFRDLVCRAE